MALAKRKVEPFEVPDPSAISDTVNAALAEKGQLEEQHRELKQREAHLSEQLVAYNGGSSAIDDDARAQARTLQRRRQQLGEVRYELVIVNRALNESLLAYQTALGAASRRVCETVRPEWDKRLRDCATALFMFAEAHVALMELKQQLQDREVRWLAFLPNVQFNNVIDGLRRDDLRELVSAGVVKANELPRVLRDRFDL